MAKGKRYELTLKNNINDATDSSVKAHRPDFSGSSKGEVADLMVLWQEDRYGPQSPCGPRSESVESDLDSEHSCSQHPERKVAYIEVKKRTADDGKRCTVMAGSSKDQNGIEELRELLCESPPWTACYVAIKFNNREMIVLDAGALYHWLRRDEMAPEPPEHDYNYHGARLTPSGNISMVKPTLDSWESSRAGEADHIKLLHAIGVEDYYIDE